jgi:hypothetical protein
MLGPQGWTVFAGVRTQGDAQVVQQLHSNIRPVIIDVTSYVDRVKCSIPDTPRAGSHVQHSITSLWRYCKLYTSCSVVCRWFVLLQLTSGGV